MSPASTGYQVPTVTVSSSLPKRKVDDSVLIVAVVSGQDEDATATVVSNPFLDAEAVGEIEVALAALGAKGGSEQVTRVVAPSLPVASVLAVGLGKGRDEWPADVIRRAAGVAARSLNGAEAVITTLSDIDLGAAIEGLILGAYRFSDFRSDKTAPKDNGLRAITALTPRHEDRRRRQRQNAPRPSRPRWPRHAIWSTLPLLTSTPPNSPSAQRLWVRPPGSRSKCSMRRNSRSTGTAVWSASARVRRARHGWFG